jgi:lysophospholipase L1-like esterase
LGIPVIDIHKEVFENHPDPLDLFPLRSSGHFNAEGYKEVANAIVDEVKRE